MRKNHGLNDKQQAFCEYYIETRNATRSYEQAFGIDVSKTLTYGTCATAGSKLLKLDKIQNYINDRLADVAMQRRLDTDEIIIELTHIALDRTHKPSDRLKALQMLGQAQAMFTDVNKTEGDLSFNINIKGTEEEQS